MGCFFVFAALFIGIVCRDLIPGCRRERDLELVKCNFNDSNINRVGEKNNEKKGSRDKRKRKGRKRYGFVQLP